MKNVSLFLIICLCFALGCNREQSPDCFQLAGSIIKEEQNVSGFNKIRIERNVSLLVKQGETQQVVIETGKNLLPDVQISVIDSVLVVRDNNQCNLFRDFGITKVIVTSPTLKEIRNGSSYNVESEGVLRYKRLDLISNTTGGFANIRKSGDFRLSIDVDTLKVEANGFSGFYIQGKATYARISFEDEVPRFEGAQLLVNDLEILQRSANDMIVNPIESISGQIVGVGNVIAKNRPPEIMVEELWTGRLLFQ